jgi:short-subunit dehydrogenase
MDIRDKNVVLTGATGGIGRAIAVKLSEQGARLILVARNMERLTALVNELGGNRHTSVSADLGSDDGRRSVVEACREIGGDGISLLINAAGTNEFALFEQQTAAAIKGLLDTNLLSPILLSLEFLPLLQRQQQSRIINIGSTFGSIGYPGFSAYCASKFGLRGFTEALRRELADSPTRISYIAPRATRTDSNSDTVVAMNDELGTVMDDPSLVADEVMQVIRGPANTDKYIGWPEKLFVLVNALFPGIVDNSLRKQLPIIRRFAKSKP